MSTEKELHDGSILEIEMRTSPLNYSEVARRLGTNRKTLYNWFAKPELPETTARRVGDVIGVDLIAKYPKQFTGEKPFQANVSERLRNLNESDVSFWKEKYLELQDKYIKLLESKSATI